LVQSSVLFYFDLNIVYLFDQGIGHLEIDGLIISHFDIIIRFAVKLISSNLLFINVIVKYLPLYGDLYRRLLC